MHSFTLKNQEKNYTKYNQAKSATFYIDDIEETC